MSGEKVGREKRQLDHIVMSVVLDACCGSRMMWFDKSAGNVLM
jgi:hypothetical protein